MLNITKAGLAAVAVTTSTLTLTAAPAEAAATRIVPKIWIVETSDSMDHTVGLGETYQACASNPVKAIELKVRVKNAHKGSSFREVWLLNGVKTFAQTDTWNSNGDGPDHFGLTTSNPSLEDGVWKVKFVKSGRILGQSRVTLQTDSTC